ncbi:MAG: sodium/glutamate symporter [Zoogloeaceae bacterium]|nr:sodium/glutamate symporter [Zoogloeaceae bacterium]
MEYTPTADCTLIAVIAVLVIGCALVKRVRFLSLNIPEPVAGGLVAALLALGQHCFTGLALNIDPGLQNSLMLVFFAFIGLNADFSRPKAGCGAFIRIGKSSSPPGGGKGPGGEEAGGCVIPVLFWGLPLCGFVVQTGYMAARTAPT